MNTEYISTPYKYLLKRIRHFTTFWLMYLGCLKWYILQQIHENGFVCVVINCIDKSSATICIPQDTAAASTILHNSTTDTIFFANSRILELSHTVAIFSEIEEEF